MKKKYQTSHTIDGVEIKTREGILWYGVKNRCYGGRNKAYIGCTMSENFLDFQFFAEWCNNQIGWGEEGWCLDKDFLVEGNKVYSENTCVFVPRVINTIFANKHIETHENTGAIWISHSNKWQARASEFGKQKNYGLHNTPEEAHAVWAARRNVYVQEVAEMYKGRIRDEVYQKLKAYSAS